MNCQEFRRKTQIDPLAGDADLSAHEDECPDCAAFARAARAAEIRLRVLLRGTTPPDALAGNIRDALRNGDRQRRHYVLAFGLLLLVGISMLLMNRHGLDQRQPALVSAVLDHIGAELHHLQAQGRIPDSHLHLLFKRFGARLTDSIGHVRFAGECLMRERTGVHLVLPGRLGPVTVFFMPGEETDVALPVTSTDFAGTIVPTHWGSIAVIGTPGEDTASIGDRMISAVNWPTSG